MKKELDQLRHRCVCVCVWTIEAWMCGDGDSRMRRGRQRDGHLWHHLSRVTGTSALGSVFWQYVKYVTTCACPHHFQPEIKHFIGVA